MSIRLIILSIVALSFMNFTFTGEEEEKEGVVDKNAPVCYREISMRRSGYYVELNILSKKSISNVARIYEKIPKGYKAKAYKLNGAQLLPNDEKLRLIWYGLPSQDTVKISYFLIPTTNDLDEPKLKGKFQYLDANFKRSEVSIRDGNDI